MKRAIFYSIQILFFAGFIKAPLAQEISLPDPGLNAAVRAALGKPAGTLTQDDMLTLTNLDASRRNIKSIEGLETAHNLATLNLQINNLTNLMLPGSLNHLVTIELTSNPLTNLVISTGLTRLASIQLEGSAIDSLSLPADLTALTNLDLENNQLRAFNLPPTLTRLVNLDLGFNAFTDFSLPAGLTNLSSFYFAGNPLTNLDLPTDLAALTDLNLSQNLLTHFALPNGMTNLEELDLAFNQLTNLSLPNDLVHLSSMDLDLNKFTDLAFLPTNLPRLSSLHLRGNQFTNFNLATPLPALSYLDVSESPLASFSLSVPLKNLATLRLSGNQLHTLILPPGLANLKNLNLSSNPLTDLFLPPDLHQLDTILLGGDQLRGIQLPPGLTNLTGLFLTGNQLTNITLPPDMTALRDLGFLGNPLTTLVVPDSLTNNLATAIAALQGDGIPVYTYASTVELVRPRLLTGAVQFGITGPPGAYTIFASDDLNLWKVLAAITNRLGAISYTDVTANLSAPKYYRASLQGSPTNMVFIPPNTFTMGSPASDFDHSSDEVPQTIVTLTHGFWIGQYEVTEAEYLSVMDNNPSAFPSDLNIAVSSVRWMDATNYCAKLTARDLAAGRIAPGSYYRLPTEAEWECAARAGTTTRFSFGDDPQYANVPNYAWIIENANLMAHRVGQKLPNPWGLYDIYGNVWEWCMDWYGPLPGGSQTDPTGPASNALDFKVMRGGAFDYPNSSARSAARLFFAATEFHTDWDLGFRIVLVNGQ